MKPGPRTGPIGRTKEERLKQKEDKIGSDNKDKQSTTLDTKRNPSTASISQDLSTMKQQSRWQGAITMVVNINRMSRKERADKIDEIIIRKGKDKKIEEILERVTRTGTGNFNNLDDALDLINKTVEIENAGEYIRDKLEANEFLERVLSRTGSRELSRTGSRELSRTGSRELSRTGSTLSRTESILPEVDFTSSLTNKKYKNEEQYGFFDDLFRFTLNKDCYIIYELNKGKSSVYIELIKCKPKNSLPWTSLPKIKQSVKGSGRVMLYDLLHFLKTNKIIEYPQNNDDDDVCLTPEPSVGGDEYTDPDKLYTYYSDMGFNPKEEEGSRYWCGKISDIMTGIDTIVGITTLKEGTPDGLLIKLGDIAEEDGDYGGGRRKRTKKKRTRRKTRKSRKSRRRR